MALQIRRGTDAERQSITPAEGELIYTTDTNQLFVGGKISPSTTLSQGGILVSGALVNDTNPTLSTNLDLNGHDITGSGNININGTITATGSINLGDGIEDNVVVGGQIASSLIPGQDKAYDLGAPAGAWANVYTSSIDVETTASIGTLEIGSNIVLSDSTVIYDVTSGNLSVDSAAIAGDIDFSGNLVNGSVIVYNGDTGDLSAANIIGLGDTNIAGSITSASISTGNIFSTSDLVVDGTATSTSVITNSLTAGDGILEVTGSLNVSGNLDVAANMSVTSVFGDFYGSLFGSDSGVLVDAINSTISGSIIGNVDNDAVTTDFLIVNGDAKFGSVDFPAEVQIRGGTSAAPLAIFGVTEAFGGNAPQININSFRGTVDTPTVIQTGDSLGNIAFQGWDGSGYALASLINVIADDSVINPGDGAINSTIQMGSYTGYLAGNYVTINTDGRLTASQLKTGSFATGSLPTTPDAGTIVFDSTTSEFKGWNGSAWVVLG